MDDRNMTYRQTDRDSSYILVYIVLYHQVVQLLDQISNIKKAKCVFVCVCVCQKKKFGGLAA